MPPEYLTVSWDQLHRDARTLAQRLSTLGPFSGIVAVSRGGLIPAGIIARSLGCRVIETVSVVTYEGETRGEPKITKFPSAAGDGAGFVIIDDLVDTGATARQVRALLPRARLAAVYAKPAGKQMADIFVTEVSQDTWILLPWDSEPDRIVPSPPPRTGHSC